MTYDYKPDGPGATGDNQQFPFDSKGTWDGAAMSTRHSSSSGLCGTLPRHWPRPDAGFNLVNFPSHFFSSSDFIMWTVSNRSCLSSPVPSTATPRRMAERPKSCSAPGHEKPIQIVQTL